MSGTQNNSVAIIIAAYNASGTIGKAVQSALSQKHVSQVLVVDDASKDNTASIAEQSDDGTNRLKVLTLAKNGGPSTARNLALDHVEAVWFTVVDADDFLLDGRVEKLISAAGEDFDILADDLWLLQEGAPIDSITPMLGIEPSDSAAPMSLEYFIDGNIPNKNRVRRELGFLKPIIRTQTLRNNKLRYSEKMRLGEDYDLYVRLLAAGAKAGLISTQGYIAVRRQHSLSGQHGHPELEQLYKSMCAHQKLPNLSTATKHFMKQARTGTSLKYRWAKMIHAVKHKNLFSFFSCFTTSPNNIRLLICNLVLSAQEKIHKKSLSKAKLKANASNH